MSTVTDADRDIRVLHIVSDGAISTGLRPTLLLPLLTRAGRQRVQNQVIAMAVDAVPGPMLRQHGIPVHDISFPGVGWSPRAAAESRQVVRQFQPDIIQAWGLEAQLLSLALCKHCDPSPRLMWCVTQTEPFPVQAGWLVRRRMSQAVRASAMVDRLIYASSASAARHVRLGFTGLAHDIINPGVDALRFKPDTQARVRLREQLQVPADAWVIGVHASMQAGSGHEVLLRAAAELVKHQSKLYLLLAGQGVHQGNAALMATIGNGALATRCQLLGEWSDLAGFYNASDLVCSPALDDSGRMQLAMAMLCAVPCVATGPGAQGEVIARHGVVVEPGSVNALLKGMQKILNMDAAHRARLVQGARQHAMTHYVAVRTVQKYLHLYCDLLGVEPLLPTAADTGVVVAPVRPDAREVFRVQAPVLDADAQRIRSQSAETMPVSGNREESMTAATQRAAVETLPKWRQDQAREQARHAAQVLAAVSHDGDVLQLFEQKMQAPVRSEQWAAECARGVADESEILLSPEALGMTVEMQVTEEALLAAGWHSQDAARVGVSSRMAVDAVVAISAARAAMETARGEADQEEFELSLAATGAQPLLSQARVASVSDMQALVVLEEAARPSRDESPLSLAEDEVPRLSNATTAMEG